MTAFSVLHLHLLLLLLSGLLPHCIAICYFPDGISSDDRATPCNQITGSVGACCRTKEGEVCQPNGLCYNPNFESKYWRESCSDPTWQSANCLKDICLEGSLGGTSTNGAQLTPCNKDGTFCCGLMNPDTCCASTSRITLAAIIGQPLSSSSSLLTSSTKLISSDASTITPFSTLLSTSSSMTFTGDPSTSSTAVPASDSESSISNETKIGVGVGVPLGIIAVAAIATFILLERRKQRRTEPTQALKNRRGVETVGTSSYQAQELEGHGKAAELSSGMTYRELHGIPVQ